MGKFVIFGAGERGKTMAYILKKENIAAFIDSNEDIVGSKVMDIEVISFQMYLDCYREYPVVVTPIHHNSIIALLNQEDIFFFHMEDCPRVFRGQGWGTFERKIMNREFDFKKNVVIYGCTIYSIWVYEQLFAKGKYELKMVPHDGINDQYYEWMVHKFPNINFEREVIVNETTDILCTVDDEYINGLKGRANVIDAFHYEEFTDIFVNYEIRKMRNSHHGQKCFIVATGPSLRIEDLDELEKNNVTCIGVNRIFESFKSTKWRPQYYVVSDAACIHSWENEIRALEIKNVFVSDSCVFFDYDNIPVNIQIYHQDANNRINKAQGHFSDDFSKIVYPNGTVTNVSIQLAVYLGFKEIYLLGVDFTSGKKGHTHFYSEKNKQKNIDYVSDMMLLQERGYKAAREYADRNGIKIYNATRGGMLEVFERVDFDSLFNSDCYSK